MLTADEARLLDLLTLGGRVSPAVAASASIRQARHRGAGTEFHEYRRYQPGDDPRSIDWRIEARLRQLFVRVARADGHLVLHLLVDTSASMRLGTPSKLSCAAKVASALCYAAIEGRDAAGIATFSDRLHQRVHPGSGRNHLSRTFALLDGLSPSGTSRLDAVLETYASIARGPGLVIVLSDFFDPGYAGTGVQALMSQGLTPALLPIASRDEVEPRFADIVELRDVEDEAEAPIVADASSIAAYRQALDRHLNDLRATCVAHGLPFARLLADAPFPLLLRDLETAGLLGMR